MANKFNLDSISDEVLLRRLSEILKESRRVEVELVAHIGEVDQRRLYARSEASPSMFVYCTETLHLSGAETYLRSPSHARRASIQRFCRCWKTVACT